MIISTDPFPENFVNENNRFQFKVKIKQGERTVQNEADLNLTLPLPTTFNLEEFLDQYLTELNFEKL